MTPDPPRPQGRRLSHHSRTGLVGQAEHRAGYPPNMTGDACPGTVPRGLNPYHNAGKPPPARDNQPPQRHASTRALAPVAGRRGTRAGPGTARSGAADQKKCSKPGLAEFDERGFQAVRVDDVVRRAKTSHGTFYLYFSNKEDLLKALLSDALIDMAARLPRVPRGHQKRGRAAGPAAVGQRVLRRLHGARLGYPDPQPGGDRRRGGLGRRPASSCSSCPRPSPGA